MFRCRIVEGHMVGNNTVMGTHEFAHPPRAGDQVRYAGKGDVPTIGVVISVGHYSPPLIYGHEKKEIHGDLHVAKMDEGPDVIFSGYQSRS